MFRLDYTSYYKLVRPSKDKDPGPRYEFIIRERSLFISVGGRGGDGVVPQLINNSRSLNEYLALSG